MQEMGSEKRQRGRRRSLRPSDQQPPIYIQLAFVFGSIARQEETAASDIDLLVIGKLGLRGLTGLLPGVAEQVGREINPHVMSLEDFKARHAAGNHFIAQIMAANKIFTIGGQDELDAMG